MKNDFLEQLENLAAAVDTTKCAVVIFNGTENTAQVMEKIQSSLQQQKSPSLPHFNHKQGVLIFTEFVEQLHLFVQDDMDSKISCLS